MPVGRLLWLGTVVLLVAVLGGCGGSSGGDTPAPPVTPPAPAPLTREQSDAFRFLNQASFGATVSAADEVVAQGYEAWIDAQMALPASLELPHMQALPVSQSMSERQRDRIDIWFRNAVAGPDQLRQRMAFALSEIFVVSQVGALEQAPYGLASFYDLLATQAFGNFRELLESVTLHPAMGVYLSMLGNQRPDPARNIRPDENYARELMQLFTVGLVELELDGTPKLDASGRPIPTYDQEVIEGFAHVYTGWTYAGVQSFRQARRTVENQVLPMQLYPDFHATGEKLLLRGVTLPAGRSGTQDLEDALDNVFEHPNVAPFVAQRLIQRLTTSNPSPAYVERVARRFENNGSGVRGDLAAVVKAILLDDEARSTTVTDRSGKLKEPLLRMTQLWRAYGGRAASGSYAMSNPASVFGQGPLQSPSVFNFFSPTYSPPGELRDAGLAAPELEIANEYQNTVLTNRFATQALSRNSRSAGVRADDVVIDIGEEIAIAPDTAGLVATVDRKLLASEMSPVLRDELTQLLNRLSATDDDLARTRRAAQAVYFVIASPEFAVQR